MIEQSIFERHGVADAQVIDALGVSAEALRLWKRGKRRIGVDHARAINRLFAIPLRDLRPDLWGSAAEAAA